MDGINFASKNILSNNSMISQRKPMQMKMAAEKI